MSIDLFHLESVVSRLDYPKNHEMRTPIVAGNWKMHGNIAMAQSLCQKIAAGASELKNVEIIVSPPFILIPTVAAVLKNTSIILGAQDMDTHQNGAYTGQISATMLTDAECKSVILGHSERRIHYGESDALVAEKVATALSNGLIVILCIGETKEERESSQTNQVVSRQINAVINRNGIDAFKNIVIAYEPVWAIGTGLTATPDQAQEVHSVLREQIAIPNASIAEGCRILYGGSMKPENAGELIAKPDIDGGLIGAAALQSEEFLNICRTACQA